MLLNMAPGIEWSSVHVDGNLRCRIGTLDEVEYLKNGGILQFVLRDLAKAA